ncbi:hypothetical protein MHYP_G00171920 [Metynnis hypsauchen]
MNPTCHRVNAQIEPLPETLPDIHLSKTHTSQKHVTLTHKHQIAALWSSPDVPLVENGGDLLPRQEDYCLVGPVCVCLGRMMGGALLLTQLNGPQAGLLHITVVQRSVNSTHRAQITLISRFFKDEKRPVLK